MRLRISENPDEWISFPITSSEQLKKTESCIAITPGHITNLPTHLTLEDGTALAIKSATPYHPSGGLRKWTVNLYKNNQDRVVYYA